MVRRPKPRPNPQGGFDPNGASAKAGLDRSISDSGWGQLLSMIAYKAEEADRRPSTSCGPVGPSGLRPVQGRQIDPLPMGGIIARRVIGNLHLMASSAPGSNNGEPRHPTVPTASPPPPAGHPQASYGPPGYPPPGYPPPGYVPAVDPAYPQGAGMSAGEHDPDESPPRTGRDAGAWLMFAGLGFIVGQVASSILLVVVAAVTGHSGRDRAAGVARRPAGLGRGHRSRRAVARFRGRHRARQPVARDRERVRATWASRCAPGTSSSGPSSDSAARLLLLPVLYLPLEHVVPHLDQTPEGARPAPHRRVPRLGPRHHRRADGGGGAGDRRDVLPGPRPAGPAPGLQGRRARGGCGPGGGGGRGHLRPGPLRAAPAARPGRVRGRPGPDGLQIPPPRARGSSPTACSTCWRSCRWRASCTDHPTTDRSGRSRPPRPPRPAAPNQARRCRLAPGFRAPWI